MSFHYSTYFSSIFSKSFHYSAWVSSIFLVSNTYCVVFLFCFSSSCVPYVAIFSELSFFLIVPSLFSNVYQTLSSFKLTKHIFIDFSMTDRSARKKEIFYSNNFNFIHCLFHSFQCFHTPQLKKCRRFLLSNQDGIQRVSYKCIKHIWDRVY